MFSQSSIIERTTEIAFIKQGNVKNWFESNQYLCKFSKTRIKKTRLQCWLSSSAGITPEVNLRNSLHAGKGVPGFETQDRHYQVQNRGISGSTKRTDVPQFF